MASPIPGTTVEPAGRAVTGDGAKKVLLLVFAVFFILGGVTNINDILIPKLQGLYQLSHFQANLVQFAFFTSYAIFSIPAGILLRKLGYIRGFVTGFLIVAVGALLFLPAANTGAYGSFLAALFVIGGGITMLQVAMNPVVVTLGDPATASSRLTFAQAFNSVGVFLMVYGGAELLLGDTAPADTSAMSSDQLTAYRVEEAAVIGHAYIGVAIAMVAIAALFWIWRKALDGQKVEETAYAGTFALLASTPRLQFGALCIFTYVGAEVAIASNMVSYMAEDRVLSLSPVEGGRMVALYWGGAMIGRILGGFVLRAIPPGTVLMGAALINIALLAISMSSGGGLAAWTLVACGLFNSIMFPTIFSLSTQGLNERAAQASGILCTAIVGGALVPPALGLVADAAGLSLALLVPMICYAVIAAFGRYARSRGVNG
jgi:FHS family L-fucose permease-like MFS transporter